jgi:hypothetical protein
MDMERKSANEEVSEYYPESIGRIGGRLISGEPHLLIIDQQAQFLKLAVVRRRKLGSIPA